MMNHNIALENQVVLVAFGLSCKHGQNVVKNG